LKKESGVPAASMNIFDAGTNAILTNCISNESVVLTEKRRETRRQRNPTKRGETLRDKNAPAIALGDMGDIFACSHVTGLFQLKASQGRCLPSSNRAA